MKKFLLILLLVWVASGAFGQESEPNPDLPEAKAKHFIGSDFVNFAFFSPNLHYEFRTASDLGFLAEGGYTVKLPYGGIKNTIQNRHSGPFARAGVLKYFTNANQKGGFSLGLLAYWGEASHQLSTEISHFYGVENEDIEVRHQSGGFSIPMGVWFRLPRAEIFANLIYNRVLSIRRDDYARRGYVQPGMGVQWSRANSGRVPVKGLLWFQYGIKFRLNP